MCQSRRPWVSEEKKRSRSAQASQRRMQWVADARHVLYCTVLHCAALCCTILDSTVEVKVGNHRISSANSFTVLLMISVPSWTPFPLSTPIKKIPCFWVRWLRSWGPRTRCHRRTRRRVASTRCSTVALCPLVEHGGLEAEVRWTIVMSKIGQDFNSDIH